MKEVWCGRLPHDQAAECGGRIHLSGCPKIGVHFLDLSKMTLEEVQALLRLLAEMEREELDC
jgi:hypothetical protein